MVSTAASRHLSRERLKVQRASWLHGVSRRTGGRVQCGREQCLGVQAGNVQHSPGLRSCDNMVLKPQGDRSAAAAPVHHGIGQQGLQPRGCSQRGQQDFDAAAAAALVALAQQLASTLHKDGQTGHRQRSLALFRLGKAAYRQCRGVASSCRSGTASQAQLAWSHVFNTTIPADLAVVQGVGEELDDLAVHSVRSMAA